MNRRLIVLRHAKATHKPGFADVDRPLTARGVRDADAAGEWLRDHELIPDLVLCSSSLRTRETWDHVASALAAAAGVEVRYDPRLYTADTDQALEVIAEDPGDAGTILLVGHNPVALQIVCRLTARSDLEFPTSALAEVGLSDWDRLAPGTGMIHSLWTPTSEHD